MPLVDSVIVWWQSSQQTDPATPILQLRVLATYWHLESFCTFCLASFPNFVRKHFKQAFCAIIKAQGVFLSEQVVSHVRVSKFNSNISETMQLRHMVNACISLKRSDIFLTHISPIEYFPLSMILSDFQSHFTYCRPFKMHLSYNSSTCCRRADSYDSFTD